MTPPSLIDVHAHFVMDEYVRQAKAAGHVHPDQMPGWPGWTAQDALSLMDETGVARAVLSISSPGVHFGDDAQARELARLVNDFGSEVGTEHPGRFGLFASLPLPDTRGSLAELARAFDELGADGVVLLSSYDGRYLDDDEFAPVLAELDRRSAVVFIHPTTPAGAQLVSPFLPMPALEFPFDTTRLIGRLLWKRTLDDYPNIRMIVPHGGATLPLLIDRLEMLRPLFSDAPLSRLTPFWYDLAGTPFPHQVPALLQRVSEDRLVYGSDCCWTSPSGVRAALATIDDAAPPAGAATWRELTTTNANRLLGTGNDEAANELDRHTHQDSHAHVDS